MESNQEEAQEEKIVRIDQLPDDPLAMPPPFWRNTGAANHIHAALVEMKNCLAELIPIHQRTEKELRDYYARYPEGDPADEDLEKFSEITSGLYLCEVQIMMKSEVAILMSAIEMEDILNRFCVYNLHKNIAEAIESMSPSEKLAIAVAIAVGKNIKGDNVYAVTKKLSQWRNAFAHGHCTDRPTDSLRKNHLIHPDQYWSLHSVLTDTKTFVESMIIVSDYLSSISVNKYLHRSSMEILQIRSLLRHIGSYHIDGSGSVYSITMREI